MAIPVANVRVVEHQIREAITNHPGGPEGEQFGYSATPLAMQSPGALAILWQIIITLPNADGAQMGQVISAPGEIPDEALLAKEIGAAVDKLRGRCAGTIAPPSGLIIPGR